VQITKEDGRPGTSLEHAGRAGPPYMPGASPHCAGLPSFLTWRALSDRGTRLLPVGCMTGCGVTTMARRSCPFWASTFLLYSISLFWRLRHHWGTTLHYPAVASLTPARRQGLDGAAGGEGLEHGTQQDGIKSNDADGTGCAWDVVDTFSSLNKIILVTGHTCMAQWQAKDPSVEFRCGRWERTCHLLHLPCHTCLYTYNSINLTPSMCSSSPPPTCRVSCCHRPLTASPHLLSSAPSQAIILFLGYSFCTAALPSPTVSHLPTLGANGSQDPAELS